MLRCLFCQPINTIVKSVQDIAMRYTTQAENRKRSSKSHKKSDITTKHKNVDDFYCEDLTNDKEFMKRFKLLNSSNYDEHSCCMNVKTESCIFHKITIDESTIVHKHIDGINKVISSVKCLTDCIQQYGNCCMPTDDQEFANNYEWLRNRDRKYLDTCNKHKRLRDTHNYLFKEYTCLPKKHAPSVLYKICCILEQILPYVGYIALNAWKDNKFNQVKLMKLHKIHLYLLFARRELLMATECYTANKEQQLVKQKINSLWWALNAAKKQLHHVKRKSQIHLKYTPSTSGKSSLFKKFSMFSLLKNCCLDENYLKRKQNPVRRCITDINLPKLSNKVLKAFRIDKNTLIRRPQSR